MDNPRVTLDTYNSDLNLVLDSSGYSAHPLTDEGFAFMWAGARSTYGVKSGKICYEVKVVKQLPVDHLPPDEMNPHVVRVGFSVEDSTLQLGEDPLSYGYGGTGKASTNCQFKNYGTPFMEGDVVTAFLDMKSDTVEMSFAKNGRFQGVAYRVPKHQLKYKALYPHVLTKNCSFEVNFGQKEHPYFCLPDGCEDYVFVDCLHVDQRERGTKPPKKKEDCEMIMMCGLPGCGKSTWAAEYTVKHPEKKYNVLGTNNIIDKMKVMGLPRKRNYAGRWDVLIKMSTKCLNKMMEMGSRMLRNFILDQTNVYPTAQRRKMRPFEGFKRSAVVIVPTEEEFKQRCDKRDREEGKEIPDSAVLEMKANFKMPEVGDLFEDVIFTELPREKAEPLVRMYNEEGQAVVGPPQKRFRPNDPSPGRGPPQRGGGGRGGFDRNRSPGGYNSPNSRGGGGGSWGGGGGRRSPPRDNYRGGQGRGGYGSPGPQRGYSPSGGNRSSPYRGPDNNRGPPDGGRGGGGNRTWNSGSGNNRSGNLQQRGQGTQGYGGYGSYRDNYSGSQSQGYNKDQGYNQGPSYGKSDYNQSPGYGKGGDYGQTPGYGKSGDYGQSPGYGKTGDYGQSPGYGKSGDYGQSPGYGKGGDYSQTSAYSKGGDYNQSSGYGKGGEYNQSSGYGKGGGDYSQSPGYGKGDYNQGSGYNYSQGQDQGSNQGYNQSQSPSHGQWNQNPSQGQWKGGSGTSGGYNYGQQSSTSSQSYGQYQQPQQPAQQQQQQPAQQQNWNQWGQYYQQQPQQSHQPQQQYYSQQYYGQQQSPSYGGYGQK